MIASPVSTGVSEVAVLNAAPGLRTRCSTNHSPTSSMSPSASARTATLLDTTSTAYAVRKTRAKISR